LALLGGIVVDLQASLEFIATFSCALFSGAALYVNAVEHPARMSVGTKAAVTEWIPSYKRGAWMQAPLAIAGCVSAVGAWLVGAGLWWLIGGVLFGLVVPFTFLVIMPTNQRLLFPGLDTASMEAHGLLNRWNRLHSVRTVLSVVAFVLFLAVR
jgi:hypothetical protein